MNVSGTPSRRGAALCSPSGKLRAGSERSRMGDCLYVVVGDLGANDECTVGCGEECGARNEGCGWAAGQLDGGVKSLASGCVWRDHALLVTR